MGEIVFGNELFDHWLNQKSLEILGKVEKEKISTEDMLILSLKAQTNHFHHMDQEFREEFKKIGQNFEQIDVRFKQIDVKFEQMDVKFGNRFEQMDAKFENRFEQMDVKFEKRFEQVDKRFDRMTTIMMWQGGILVTLISGLYFKLFLG